MKRQITMKQTPQNPNLCLAQKYKSTNTHDPAIRPHHQDKQSQSTTTPIPKKKKKTTQNLSSAINRQIYHKCQDTSKPKKKRKVERKEKAKRAHLELLGWPRLGWASKKPKNWWRRRRRPMEGVVVALCRCRSRHCLQIIYSGEE